MDFLFDMFLGTPVWFWLAFLVIAITLTAFERDLELLQGRP